MVITTQTFPLSLLWTWMTYQLEQRHLLPILRLSCRIPSRKFQKWGLLKILKNATTSSSETSKPRLLFFFFCLPSCTDDGLTTALVGGLYCGSMDAKKSSTSSARVDSLEVFGCVLEVRTVGRFPTENVGWSFMEDFDSYTWKWKVD